MARKSLVLLKKKKKGRFGEEVVEQGRRWHMKRMEREIVQHFVDHGKEFRFYVHYTLGHLRLMSRIKL